MFKSIKLFLGSKKKKARVLLSQDAKPLPKFNFEAAMDAALDDSVLPRKRAQKLLDVYPLLCQPCFKYSNTKDTEWAMDYMLALWNSILDMMNAYGDRLPATTRMAAMKCVISIVKRNEFRLESLGFNDATISIDKDSEKVCKRYCTLLTKSLIFATKRMNEVELRAVDLGSDRCIGRGLLYNEDYAQGEMYFYSEILAISYFRIPGIAARLITRIREILLYKAPHLLRIDSKDLNNSTRSSSSSSINMNNNNDNDTSSRNINTNNNKNDDNNVTQQQQNNQNKSKTINIGFRYFMPASMNIAYTSSTGRVIGKNTSVMTKISLQTDEELENTKFVELNPSLFFWKFICKNEHDEKEISNCFQDTESLWLDKFSVSGYFYSSFVHAWISHIKEIIMSVEGNYNNNRLIRFTTIPGFVIILKLFLSLLRDRYLNELDTIKRRTSGKDKHDDKGTSVDDPDASNNDDDDNNNTIDMEALLFNRFVIDTPRGVSMLMNTSKEFLVICPYLFNFWIAIALENTSLHFPQCVEICFVDIGEWLNCLNQIATPTDTLSDSPSTPATNGNNEDGNKDRSAEAMLRQKKQQQVLPSLIKTNLLPKALTILTKAEHHRQLLCAFRFIYKQKQMLTRLRFNMCYDLFENHLLRFNTFFNFFLHWDYVVRLHFFHIIVYRLFSIPRQELRLKTDETIVKNLLEVVLSRKRRYNPEDDLNINLNLRLAGVVDSHLSRIYHYIQNPENGPMGLPENKLVYCKSAYNQYVKVIQEYYRRATATTNGVVIGPKDVVLFEDNQQTYDNLNALNSC